MAINSTFTTQKLAWAFLNRFAPAPVRYKEQNFSKDEAGSSILVVAIDYDKFMSRNTKTVGQTTYRCGREGLEHVLSYCEAKCLDYLSIITTDDATAPVSYHGPTNKTIRIRNGGSDIAALDSISDVIRKYSFVIVINSSANVADAHKIGAVHHELRNAPKGHFVMGYNGNSRISPRLPLSPARTPHVITNFFAAPAQDVLDTLEHAKRSRLYSRTGGFANKYFAIRYFEILLSRNALFNDGMLVLLKNNDIVYYRESRDAWPESDSRLLPR